jgi:riboflavin synthase alpha subunit
VFSGIVSQRARVAEACADGGAGAAAALVRVAVDLERPLLGTAVGDSVAIDGVCLTVVGIEGRRVRFDAIPETLRKTTLGRRRPGDRVNVEGALRAGDPIGGHLVQGHVDGVGTVRAVERRGDDVRLVVSLPEGLLGATIPKGSVAVDGVSLTVGESEEDWFSVYLIPHTLAATGLGERRVGDEVNLEADVVGRYVEHHVRRLLPGAPGAGALAWGAASTGRTKE